jgi:hypothetical protein
MWFSGCPSRYVNPKTLGKGVEVALTPIRRLDVDASFVSGACRAAPVFAAAGSALGVYRSKSQDCLG